MNRGLPKVSLYPTVTVTAVTLTADHCRYVSEGLVHFRGILHHEKSYKRTNLPETYLPVGTFRNELSFATDPSMDDFIFNDIQR